MRLLVLVVMFCAVLLCPAYSGAQIGRYTETKPPLRVKRLEVFINILPDSEFECLLLHTLKEDLLIGDHRNWFSKVNRDVLNTYGKDRTWLRTIWKETLKWDTMTADIHKKFKINITHDRKRPSPCFSYRNGAPFLMLDNKNWAPYPRRWLAFFEWYYQGYYLDNRLWFWHRKVRDIDSEYIELCGESALVQWAKAKGHPIDHCANYLVNNWDEPDPVTGEYVTTDVTLMASYYKLVDKKTGKTTYWHHRGYSVTRTNPLTGKQYLDTGAPAEAEYIRESVHISDIKYVKPPPLPRPPRPVYGDCPIPGFKWP